MKICVFPRLLSLSYKGCFNADSQRLYLFLSPTLRRCVLPVLHSETKSLGTQCAVVEDLCVWDPIDGQTADHFALLSDTVRSCKKLVALCCPPLNSSAWKHLSDLHTLLTVEIHGVFRPLDGNHLKFAPFLNITTLSFDLKIATGLITLLQHSEFPSLKKFEFLGRMSSWEVEHLFGVLSQCNTRRTLEHIDISLRWYTVQDPCTLIRQLFCFTQLQALYLSFCDPSVYLDNDPVYPDDNDFLLEAMTSWPHIPSLQFRDKSANRHPGVTAALPECPDWHTLCSC
ncbi:hypothetical protein K503DRAFT_773702 [Rhizopogon vinicolor AM-OR11-026]|uniref:F-box domain-containing protein n=1 Tax=Rhizopogon vinicolor AM-OR11-026 TaxID=1314800 RepID=A0A1B7MRH9_9AGAM|nr:hypothetical protein K503DRAFT_773702 [Rhizopogon vinicolor AM-OR11-026]